MCRSPLHKQAARLGAVTAAVTILLPVAAVAAAPDLPVWGSVPSRDRGPDENALLDIDIISADDIWAVGEYNSGVPPTETGRRTLAQHWDGERWRLVRTRNPSFEWMDFANLEGVSGVAADDVWAVGHGDDFSSPRSTTLVEHWNGTRWRIVPSPNPAGTGAPNRLFGVLARSADDVWAVGEQGTPEQALIVRFNGRKWRAVPNDCGGPLRAITDVPGTSTLWAVGENTTCFYDGETWDPVPQPDFPNLEDVSAVSATEVWTAGFEIFCDPFQCYSNSLIQRWNGSQWTNVEQPLAAQLRGVEVVAADDVWAVGTNNIGTVIQHWDGTAWTRVPSPDPDAGGELNAIDAEGSTAMWSAGAFFGAADQQTLILQAPSTTQGQVVGETNVGGATVSWFGKVDGSTSTNQFGAYNIPGLPAGRYTLVVNDRFGGCDPESAKITVEVNQTLVKDFQLDC